MEFQDFHISLDFETVVELIKYTFPKNTSTKLYNIMKNTPQMLQRKKLIAEIAMLHRSENDLIKSVLVERKNEKEDNQYTQIVQEEFETLKKRVMDNAYQFC